MTLDLHSSRRLTNNSFEEVLHTMPSSVKLHVRYVVFLRFRGQLSLVLMSAFGW